MRYIILLFLISGIKPASAQQTYHVTDSMPVTMNGLEIGYRIMSEKEKEVGSKGNFSRYSVKFYVTNTSPEAKIILYKDGWNLLGSVSDKLVQFNCLNATGARLTSKSALLSANPCTVMALVDDKDCNGKIQHNKRSVQIGYWIKSAQTISASEIIIVPLNEKPNVEVQYLANSLQPTASAGFTDNTNIQPQPVVNTNSFLKIKNVWKDTYLNNQSGPLSCTSINSEWWSAQWQLLPVDGTSYYVIKNRWKQNFISTDLPGTMLSPNDRAQGAMWSVEPIANTNTYRIKNAANGSYLNMLSGNIQSTSIWSDSPSAKWVLE